MSVKMEIVTILIYNSFLVKLFYCINLSLIIKIILRMTKPKQTEIKLKKGCGFIDEPIRKILVRKRFKKYFNLSTKAKSTIRNQLKDYFAQISSWLFSIGCSLGSLSFYKANKDGQPISPNQLEMIFHNKTQQEHSEETKKLIRNAS